MVIDRILHARKINAEKDLIADLKVFDSGKYALLGCDREIYYGNLNIFHWFNDQPIEKLQDFRIDHYGSYIYWKDLDIHMDLVGLGIRKIELIPPT